MNMKSQLTSTVMVLLSLIAVSCGSTAETATSAAQEIDESADAGDSLVEFCEEAPMLTSGVRVTVALMDELSVLLDDHLTGEDAQLLASEISTLREDLVAFEAGTGSTFDAGGVNNIIGRLCNLDLESEAVES